MEATATRQDYVRPVASETLRINQRIDWLQRKAARLPINSNGRKKASAQISELSVLAMLLTRALGGENTKLRGTIGGSDHATRALRLLHTVQATA